MALAWACRAFCASPSTLNAHDCTSRAEMPARQLAKAGGWDKAQQLSSLCPPVDTVLPSRNNTPAEQRQQIKKKHRKYGELKHFLQNWHQAEANNERWNVRPAGGCSHLADVKNGIYLTGLAAGEPVTYWFERRKNLSLKSQRWWAEEDAIGSRWKQASRWSIDGGTCGFFITRSAELGS